MRLLLLLSAACSFAAGCASVEAMRSTMQDRITGVPPKTRVVKGDTREVYEAARLAMDKLGYQLTSGGPAQGRLEGLSRVGGGDDFRSSRQRAISVHLQPSEDGGVEVQVRLSEIFEESFNRLANPATETPLRDSPGYEAFFEELARQLQGGAAK
ncbi:MAG TPA: hypothetical protein VLW52_01095 [Opitutaceae bacterium]|nr:hypothetical protein [Opitutaceae bacterium]